MKRIGEKTLKRILWVMLLLNMAAVFALSAQPASISMDETDALITLPKQVFDAAHPELADSFAYLELFRVAARKTAHFMEFATLSIWAAWLLHLYEKNRPFIAGGAFSSLYAATDELHQLVVPGRAGLFSDWLIDSAGAALGAVFLWFFLIFWKPNKGGQT